MTAMPVPMMLAELAAVLGCDEYQRDPQGCLLAWADVVTGRVRPTDHVVVGNGNGDFDSIELAILALATAGPVRNRDVRTTLGYTVSSETVRQRLRRLCGLGLLERHGQRRATRYTATAAERN